MTPAREQATICWMSTVCRLIIDEYERGGEQ